MFDALNAYHAGHQQAGGDGRDRHHHRVGKEVEEIEELHAQHRHPGQRAVAQAGQRAQPYHDNTHQHCGLAAAPAQLILEGGDRAFGQRDGAGDRCKQHQHKEQHAHCPAQVHAGKNFGERNEHQRGPRLQGVRIAIGEGKHCRNDHQARHDGDDRVEHLDVLGRVLDGDVLFHIGTESDQDAHGDGQRVEHLPHRRDHRHPAEVGGVRHQEILDARQRSRPRDRVGSDNDRQHHQHRHHYFGDTLDAVAHTRKDDAQREQRKGQEADLCYSTVGNEI